MTVKTDSVERLEDREEYAAILREYLGPEIERLEDISGQEIDLETLVAATVDNIDAYLPPRGRLWLVRDEMHRLLATICVKMVRPDTAEIKRLYVRPEGRGQGLGRRLTLMALDAARELGAGRVVLDTGQWLTPAIALYRSLGFEEIPRYPESENDAALEPYLVYMEKRL